MKIILQVVFPFLVLFANFCAYLCLPERLEGRKQILIFLCTEIYVDIFFIMDFCKSFVLPIP